MSINESTGAFERNQVAGLQVDRFDYAGDGSDDCQLLQLRVDDAQCRGGGIDGGLSGGEVLRARAFL